MREDERVTRAKDFSKIWWESRLKGNRSQEYMALALGVSKKTIQNWERGISAPNFFQGSEWFRVLGINPMPYFLACVFPELYFDIQSSEESNRLNEALMNIIDLMTVYEKKELLYIMMATHGSSWNSLLQMFTAHCHTSMKSRVSAAKVILTNYLMEKSNGELVCPDEVMPDTKVLQESIDLGTQAVFNHRNGYSTIKKED